jgi:radical SAM-linked protein
MAAESLAEYVDVELAVAVGVDEVAARLADALPAGFGVRAVAERPLGSVSLQEAVVACDWVIGLDGVDPARTREAVAQALAAAALPLSRERKGERRVDDVRPSIEVLDVDETNALTARLATTGRGLRPGELVQVLFADDGTVTARSVLRTEQWIECDGTRRELLPLPATVAVPAGAGA